MAVSASITDAAFPAFYRASDEASARYQRAYLRSVRLQLGMLMVVSALGSWSPGTSSSQELYQRLLGFGVAACMLAALVGGVLVKLRRYDDHWFQCRAFAENAKTASWRFMMLPTVTREAFLEELEEIRRRHTDVLSAISDLSDSSAQITPRMLEVRGLPLSDRAELYRQQRLDNQRIWYRAKARYNRKREHVYFFVGAAVEAVAIFAAAGAGIGGWQVNPTGLVATSATVVLAWAQTKRFSDLDTSYSQTAVDLDLLAEKFAAATEDDLGALVREVEKVVSREHRMWLSKRGIQRD